MKNNAARTTLPGRKRSLARSAGASVTENEKRRRTTRTTENGKGKPNRRGNQRTTSDNRLADNTKGKKNGRPSLRSGKPIASINHPSGNKKQIEDDAQSSSEEETAAAKKITCSEERNELADEIHFIQEDEIAQAEVHSPAKTSSITNEGIQPMVVPRRESYASSKLSVGLDATSSRVSIPPAGDQKSLRQRVVTIENDVKEMKTSIKGIERAILAGQHHNISLPEKQNVPVSRDKPKKVYEQVMDRRLPHISIAFSQHCLSRCLFNCVMGMIMTAVRENDLSPSCMLETLSAITFSLKSKDRKDEFNRGFGPAASKFRRTVMISALSHARKNTFSVFDDGKSVPSCSSTQERPSHQIPRWLNEKIKGSQDYITASHIAAAQRRNESVSGPRSDYVPRMRISNGATPSRDEVAIFAMNHLYSAITHHMNSSRKQAPAEFFQFFGYLFVDWKKYPSCKVNDSHVSLTWCFDEAIDVTTQKSDIPTSVVISDCCSDAAAENEERYKEFARSRTELMIAVEHDVLVKQNGKRSAIRKHIGDERKKWKRIINLMDAAAYFLKGICGIEKQTSIFQMLQYNRNSIAAIFYFAKALRLVVGHVMNLSDGSRFGLMDGNGADAEMTESEKTFQNIFRKMTLASSSGGIERALVRATCAIPQEVFDAENIEEYESDQSDSEALQEEISDETADDPLFDM